MCSVPPRVANRVRPVTATCGASGSLFGRRALCRGPENHCADWHSAAADYRKLERKRQQELPDSWAERATVLAETLVRSRAERQNSLA